MSVGRFMKQAAERDYSKSWQAPVSYTHLDVYKRQILHL